MKLLIITASAMIALTGCEQLGMGGGNNTADNATANVATNEATPPADANAAKPADGAGNEAAPVADPAASGDKPEEGGAQPEPTPGDKPAE
jgi:hypothetical protein